jgi:hypothetical protein
MQNLYLKFVEPGLFPLVAYAVALGASWYGRNKYGEDGGLLDVMRVVVTFSLVCSYLVAWHQEIAAAWTKYPNLTARVFVALFTVIVFTLIPKSLWLIFARQGSTKTGQGG